AVRKIRQSPSDSNVRDTFFSAARAFHSTLNPYLLRRDKREDPAVQKFTRHTGEEYHTYRRENEILIETNNLSTNWKRSVCAAEALSFVTRQSDATSAKRLRLTMGNGHGIAALIDELQRDQKDDLKQIESDGDSHHPLHQTNSEVVQPNKRMQRIDWWQNVMIQPFKNNEHALLDHPAILAAAVEIENVCQQGEKVLVFGRFTRPLRALVNLLNAREMLRNLDKGGWPQSKVHESEWSALVAAHRQLKLPGNLDRVSLNETLEQQYRNREQKRRDFRKTLIANIEAGIPLGRSSTHVRAIFYAFKAEAMTRTDQDLDNTEHTVSVVARAMLELMGPDAESASHTDFATAFADLIEAASGRDEGDAVGDGELSETEAINFWSELETRVREEYNRQEGGFARLMFGETKQATRRLLQLAFNRRHSSPKVLVAQSLVGREGLNLHKACRTVVLLHPEWNPGVVEQQIGRVDRIGSLWETMINEAISHQPSNTDLPRIEVRPVIFQGTYDEKNWQVLRERWDDLRAQLHGIVISQRIASNYDDSENFIKEFNKFAPNFSPTSS
nr:helicase-related protein [Spirochaetales bacterium]